MDIDSFRSYCLAKPGVEETLPFGPDTLVFKVVGKMFATLGLDRSPLASNLKCDPERIPDLRARHPDILPGWHMNKHHWNTVVLEGDLTDELVRELVDHSYALVVAKLPKKARAALEALS